MAFFLNNTTLASHLRSHSQGTQNGVSGRKYHTQLGPREQALLAEDPSLKRYKSHKKSVRLVKKLGDVLTVVVVAGCCYEIYVRAVTPKESQK